MNRIISQIKDVAGRNKLWISKVDNLEDSKVIASNTAMDLRLAFDDMRSQLSAIADELQAHRDMTCRQAGALQAVIDNLME